MVKFVFKAYEKFDEIFFYIFFLYLKMLTGFYQKNPKESLSKKACERYQNLSEEEKEKKRQYGR